MRILVCVKHVPDLASARGFTPLGVTERDVADSTVNEVDENALEAALQLGERHEVIALTVGPAGAADAVRRALQMGASRAVHVCDDQLAGMDAPATAHALAQAVRWAADPAPVDLVLMGMTALDGLGSVVPTMVGAELDWPVLSGAQGLEVSGAEATIERDLDGVAQRWRAQLPAVVSVSDAINSPRLPKTKDILAARSAPIQTLAARDIGAGEGTAHTRVLKAEPVPPRGDPQIVHDSGDGGAALAEYLIRHDLIGES